MPYTFVWNFLLVLAKSKQSKVADVSKKIGYPLVLKINSNKIAKSIFLNLSTKLDDKFDPKPNKIILN